MGLDGKVAHRQTVKEQGGGISGNTGGVNVATAMRVCQGFMQ